MNRNDLEVETLIDIGVKLSSARSVNKVVEYVMYNLIGLFGVQTLALYIVDRDEDQLELEEVKGGEIPAGLETVDLSEGDLRDFLIEVNDLQELSSLENYFDNLDDFRFMQPLKYQNNLVGLLLLGAPPEAEEEGGFSERSHRLISVFSSQIASALENSLLYEQLKKKTEILEETQQELIQSTKLAAIGKLASGVAHEINNPLVSMKGYARLLNRKANKDDLEKYSCKMMEEIERCEKIVNDLLTYARKDKKDTFQEINCEEIAQDALGSLKQILNNKNIDVEISKTDGYTRVQVDPDQIHQVFVNLIKNSLEVLEQGAGKITISFAEKEEVVEAKVEDNGPGIPEEARDKIFDPFFTTKETGTGLGLSIIYNIIEAHGGDIDFETGPGGTTFIVSLPRSTKS